MAEEEKNISTALAIVEEQQKVVGSALVAASGAAVLAENSDSSMQILEQIRDIQLRTLRGIGDVVTSIKDMFAFEKLQDRRLREDETEKNKENLKPDEGEIGDLPKVVNNEEGGGGKGIFGAILASVGGLAFFKKLFAPFIAIFGKSGMLVKLFGRFGPLGALILGFTLFYKYSDEIAKALAPAIDKMKEIIPKLKPLIDFLKRVGDFLIKQLLEGIGGALTLVITAVEGVLDGFKMIFEGDVMGGLNRMFGLEEGLLGFLLELPKKIFDGAKKFLGGLAEAMGIDFKKLYDSIALYVNDTITNIKNFFIDLGNNIITFFTDAYETVKTTITDAVNGAFTFFADIFNSISDFFSDSFNKVKDFITGLPDKILGFVSNMFSPITNFFSGIGNRIKEAINGIIDSLPLPEFVKDKVKFDATPETTIAETQSFDDTLPEKHKRFYDDVDKNKDEIKKFSEASGYRFSLENTKAMYNTDQDSFIFKKPDGESYLVSNTDNFKADEHLDIIKSGNKSSELEFAKLPNIDAKAVDIETAGSNGMVVVNNNNYNTNNSSVANQTDVHSGSLDTSIDAYHDKLATSSA